MDPELERILGNVQYMVSEGASESDLNAYLKDEGFTLESLNGAVGRADAERRVASGGNAVTDFLHMAAEGATGGQAETLKGLGLRGFLDMAFNAGNPAEAAGRGAAHLLRPEAQARAAAFQQRTDDLQMLAPGASLMAGGAGVIGSLAPAVSAIRVARGAQAGPFALGALPSEYGSTVPLMAPATRRTALEALRTFVRRPLVRKALEGASATGGGLAAYGLTRLLSGR